MALRKLGLTANSNDVVTVTKSKLLIPHPLPKNRGRNYQHIKTSVGQLSPLERGIPKGRGVLSAV
jgi:hypothetical protein